MAETDYWLDDTDDYYLLQHRVGEPVWSQRPDGQRLRLLVVHTAETSADTDGDDGKAEAVARYFARTERRASAHVCIDSDSVVRCLPDSVRAWHVRGYNTISWGAELCLRAAEWSQLPESYVDGLLTLAAAEYGLRCYRYDIPPQRITRAQVDGGARGIVAHADLDPGRRTDPGPDFPWERFLRMVGGVVVELRDRHHAPATPPAAPTSTPTAVPPLTDAEIARIRRVLYVLGSL